jgi:hypothetical protein
MTTLHLDQIRLPADWVGKCFASTSGNVTSLYAGRSAVADPVCIASGGPLNAQVLKALAVALNDAWRTGRGLIPKPDLEPYEVPFGAEAPLKRQAAQRQLLNAFGAAPIVTFMRHANDVAREADPLLKDLVWQQGRRGFATEYRLLDAAGNLVAADLESNKALRAARAARLTELEAWSMPLEDFELASLAIPVVRGSDTGQAQMVVVEGPQAPAGAQNLAALRVELGRIYDRASVGKEGLELAPRQNWVSSSVSQLLNRPLDCDLRTFQLAGAKPVIFYHADNPRLTPYTVRAMVHTDLVTAACDRGEDVPAEVITDLRSRNPRIALPMASASPERQSIPRPTVH